MYLTSNRMYYNDTLMASRKSLPREIQNLIFKHSETKYVRSKRDM